MKKYIYATTIILIMSLGSYTVYSEFINSDNAKKNLTTMNKKHLFASIINTTDNGEIFDSKPRKNNIIPVEKKTSKIISSKSKSNTKISSKMSTLKSKSKSVIKKTTKNKEEKFVSRKKK